MSSDNNKSSKKPDKKKLQLKEEFSERLAGESIFEQLVELFPDIIHSVDDNGRIVSTNKKELEVLGYTRDELIGMPVTKIYDKSILGEVKKGLQTLKKDGALGIQSKLVTKDGEPIDVEIRSMSLYDNEGNFAKTFSIIRDIRELKSLRAQLIQSSKLASVGELASGILHDIKNPLTVIDSYSQLIGDFNKMGKTEEIQKGVDSIQKATVKIKHILDHMRVFIRGEQRQFSAIDIRDVIEDALFMLESPIRNSSAKIINEIKSETLVQGIHNQLEQVFVNIIDNACDALAKNKTREIRIYSTAMEKNVSIFISDTGTGMPEEVASQIFQSFFTTKEKGKGTGLGLSISNGIVTEHQGKLEVISKVGEGTTFVITLPKPN